MKKYITSKFNYEESGENNMKKNKFIKELPLHLMLLPGIIMVFIFCYVPMGGILIAFQKFIPAKGLFGDQEWVGFENFEYIFAMPNTPDVFRNTLMMAIGKIVLGMIVPILIAILLSEVKNNKFKKGIQTIIYFPHFLSWVVLSGILIDILSPEYGIVNKVIEFFGGDPVFFIGDPNWFQGTMIFTEVWKSFGFGTVIYLATILGIDSTLYEATAIDGANRIKQIIHITLPGMKTIVVLLMVLNLGNILNAGFDQIFNLYSPVVYETGDIIDTMVYRMGLIDSQFGPATAVGLLKSVISTVLISSSYFIAYKWFDYEIF